MNGASPPSSSPASALDARTLELVNRALNAYGDLPGPLLQILHAIQDTIGHVPPAAIPLIAAALNLSRADVHGVVTFYHHFRQTPVGKHVIHVCQAEACRAMHCEALTQHAKRRLGVELHGTTPDGRFTLAPVYCLGNCACGPSVMIDESLHSRVTADKFDALISDPSFSS